VKTIHPSYGVSDMDRSREVHSRLGYQRLSIALDDGSRLAMLHSPRSPPSPSSWSTAPAPVRYGRASSTLAVQVDDLARRRSTS
jgi:hypothetical protein